MGKARLEWYKQDVHLRGSVMAIVLTVGVTVGIREFWFGTRDQFAG